MIFHRKGKETDWAAFFGLHGVGSNKNALIAYCRKHNIPMHLDDSSENAGGVLGELRGVASEAELQRRVSAYKARRGAFFSIIISALALAVSAASLVVAILSYGN